MGTGVQILAVSHTGIKLLQMARGSREASGQLRVLRTYRCWQWGENGARWTRAQAGISISSLSLQHGAQPLDPAFQRQGPELRERCLAQAHS